MGNDYFGRNDYRDYLAHYGVKGMKWKKRKRRSLTPEEIRAIRRNRLREQMARDMNANAKMEARVKARSKKSAGKSGGSEGGSLASLYAKNRRLAVMSGIRVGSNDGSYDPNASVENNSAEKKKGKKSVKIGKKQAKAKLAKMLGSTIKTVKGKANSKSVFVAMSKMRGTAR